MRLQLDMVKSLCGVAQKCDSNSFTLSAKPLLLRSTEKDSSFLIDARNSLKSTCVAPCFKSYCSLLRTFVIPEYFLDSFLSKREASSGKPLRFLLPCLAYA
jgi:hypothetical protein